MKKIPLTNYRVEIAGEQKSIPPLIPRLIPPLIPASIPRLIPLPQRRPNMLVSRGVERRLSAPFSNGFDLVRARRGPRETDGPSTRDGEAPGFGALRGEDGRISRQNTRAQGREPARRARGAMRPTCFTTEGCSAPRATSLLFMLSSSTELRRRSPMHRHTSRGFFNLPAFAGFPVCAPRETSCS